MRSTITLAALALALRASAQDAAPIFGTWSTGNGDVSTGGVSIYISCSLSGLCFHPKMIEIWH